MDAYAMRLAIIGFILVIVLMVLLVREQFAPPVTFIVLPLIAAIAAGYSPSLIKTAINAGEKTMINTAVLFVFSIAYFTLMDEAGLFDPIINALVGKIGKSLTALFVVIVLVSMVAHLDGSGATTFLIGATAFMPICKKIGVRPQALMCTIAITASAMNIMPWAGPTRRASAMIATQPGFETYEAGSQFTYMLPCWLVLIFTAFLTAVLVSRVEKKHGAGALVVETAGEKEEEKKTKLEVSKGKYTFNAILTIILLVCLFKDIGLPQYYLFMVAFSIALVANLPKTADQKKKIKELGVNAMQMCMTLFAVGVFVGILTQNAVIDPAAEKLAYVDNTSMVDFMATLITNSVPSFVSSHLHWFLSLFSVPIMMMIGTDAFYYGLLPVVLAAVVPLGVDPRAVAAAMLLTATYGTFISPTVASVYVGLGICNESVGEHIKYSLRFMWPMSILSLIFATLIGVVKF